MADLQQIYTTTLPTYQRPEDLDFPISKIRLFIDVMWQAITQKTLTDEQRTTLKQLIDLLNLLDEHKHESQKELIAAMLPSISPLLEKMPTLGLTGTHVFTHLVPIYQLYLPSIELMVKEAHSFTLEETLLYYELTIFDHLFLVHIFEQEHELNMIELLLTIKAIILINALVYDYQQHTQGRSISFFTFLMRGGKSGTDLQPFLLEAINHVCDEVKLTVTNAACLETLEFLKNKLIEATQKPANAQGEQTEQTTLSDALAPDAPKEKADTIFEQATETLIEPTQETMPMSDPTLPTQTPVAPPAAPPDPMMGATVAPTPMPAPVEPTIPVATPVEPAPVPPAIEPVQAPPAPAQPEPVVPEPMPPVTPPPMPEPTPVVVPPQPSADMTTAVPQQSAPISPQSDSPLAESPMLSSTPPVAA